MRLLPMEPGLLSRLHLCQTEKVEMDVWCRLPAVPPEGSLVRCLELCWTICLHPAGLGIMQDSGRGGEETRACP